MEERPMFYEALYHLIIFLEEEETLQKEPYIPKVVVIARRSDM